MILGLLICGILVAVMREMRRLGCLVLVMMMMIWMEEVWWWLLMLLQLLLAWRRAACQRWRYGQHWRRCSRQRGRHGQRQWQRQRLQAAYAVRRVRRINIAPSQMIVVVVGAATGIRWAATAAGARSIAVGAFVARPPLHVCVCNEGWGKDAQNGGNSCNNKRCAHSGSKMKGHCASMCLQELSTYHCDCWTTFCAGNAPRQS